MKRLLMLVAVVLFVAMASTAMAGWRHRAVVVAPCYGPYCATAYVAPAVAYYRPVVVAPYYYPAPVVYRRPVYVAPYFYPY